MRLGASPADPLHLVDNLLLNVHVVWLRGSFQRTVDTQPLSAAFGIDIGADVDATAGQRRCGCAVTSTPSHENATRNTPTDCALTGRRSHCASGNRSYRTGATNDRRWCTRTLGHARHSNTFIVCTPRSQDSSQCTAQEWQHYIHTYPSIRHPWRPYPPRTGCRSRPCRTARASGRRRPPGPGRRPAASATNATSQFYD